MCRGIKISEIFNKNTPSTDNKMFPVTPMLLAMVIPLTYCLIRKKESFERVLVLSLIAFSMIVAYQVVIYLENKLSYSGYFLGKLIIFTALPLIAISYFEKWSIRDALTRFGIRKENMGKSIILGIAALAITLLLGLIALWGQDAHVSLYWNIIMFLDAFNEEFLFRGVLILYLWKITDIKVAYATSIVA
ncbi:MAG: hypothetical protein JRI56_12245, partial [Deltaproteobacteria bacterium]|nr:hypothetical protein [Deltaproteobacteria bacterium]